MISTLLPWLHRRNAAPPDLPRLAAPVAVIGDIHGRADLLEALLERLARHRQADRLRLIVAGDMIDRGPDSAAVLRRLHGLIQRPGPFAELTCLMGNHERLMLDFLRDPVTHGPRWLSNGGAETLVSFGARPDQRERAADAGARLHALADELRAGLGPARQDWLSQLPLLWREERLVVVHAAALPSRQIEDQPKEVLLWGHPAFHRQTRRDGLWIAHGHTIIEDPRAINGRISVDTGAWRTGRLSAAILDREGLRFETTGTRAPAT